VGAKHGLSTCRRVTTSSWRVLRAGALCFAGTTISDGIISLLAVARAGCLRVGSLSTGAVVALCTRYSCTLPGVTWETPSSPKKGTRCRRKRARWPSNPTGAALPLSDDLVLLEKLFAGLLEGFFRAQETGVALTMRVRYQSSATCWAKARLSCLVLDFRCLPPMLAEHCQNRLFLRR
jgi:hypothetical protein